jgi:predicted transposase/invertase (TIGR01784 family)
MSNVHNPHDKLFRESMSNRDTAIDFLKNYLPAEVLPCLNLSTLEIAKDSFVSDELQAYYSDILYTVSIAGQTGYVYVLFEHKSYPDRWIHLQLLEYMLKIWRLYLKQQEGKHGVQLPVILPLVLYHHPDHCRFQPHFRKCLPHCLMCCAAILRISSTSCTI